jgi:hypothetical protein
VRSTRVAQIVVRGRRQRCVTIVRRRTLAARAILAIVTIVLRRSIATCTAPSRSIARTLRRRTVVALAVARITALSIRTAPLFTRLRIARRTVATLVGAVSTFARHRPATVARVVAAWRTVAPIATFAREWRRPRTIVAAVARTRTLGPARTPTERRRTETNFLERMTRAIRDFGHVAVRRFAQCRRRHRTERDQARFGTACDRTIRIAESRDELRRPRIELRVGRRRSRHVASIGLGARRSLRRRRILREQHRRDEEVDERKHVGPRCSGERVALPHTRSGPDLERS